MRKLSLVLILILFAYYILDGAVLCQTMLPPADVTASDDVVVRLEKKISLDLRDMDVVDVYKFLAIKGDFNISISKSIAGRITLYLNNVTIKDALDIISVANALAYKIVNGNVLQIMSEAEYVALYGKKFSDKTDMKVVYLKYAKPAYVLEALKNIKSELGKIVIDEDTGSVVMIDTPENMKQMQDAINQMDHQLETKVFTLQYANADDIATKLKEKLDNKAVGSVQADARSNQLVVRAFPERLKEVEEIVKQLDKKTKAVLIQVRILKLNLNPKFDMGINWDGIIKKCEIGALKNLTFIGSFPISSTISSATSLGSVGQIAVGTFNSDDFAVDLKALKQVVDTKVVANPSIMVVNNKEARIHIGDKLAYVTTTTIGTGESQRVNEEIHYIDVGTQFKVVPVINDNGYVTMSITPEISSQTGTLTTPQGSKVPLINSTLVETNVIVKDGQTIVIGGLRSDQVSRTRQGIPVLMDTPYLRRIFSNESSDTVKTEIVILLTPHIVSGDENVYDRKMQDKELQPDKKY